MVSTLMQAQPIVNPHGLEKLNKTPTYSQITTYYSNLAAANSTMKYMAVGPTDVADSLRVLYYSADGAFEPSDWAQSGKIIILINNGIHPGEPDGIVACMQLLWDIAQKKVTVPANVVLAVVPVFNIGGALQQRIHTRANQNGPEVTGFRGNAQNLDLNRDFMKMDALETQSMVQFFQQLAPDILIDNHVSNGADYQHIMTLLSTQHDKLGGPMGRYLNDVFEPALYKDMKTRGYDLVPYVNVWGQTPDKGWKTFIETPRFMSGYAAMEHTYAFVAETHMLKPFADRVASTYSLMQSMIKFAGNHSDEIAKSRQAQTQWIGNSRKLQLNWTVDTSVSTTIDFKGYKGGYKPSDISGQPRLYYDRSQPYDAKIPYYNHCVAKDTMTVPKAYIIPKAWKRVIDRLKMNYVNMVQFDRDTTIAINAYYISEYTTSPSPYEGHYIHSAVKTEQVKQRITFRKGDYYISTNQQERRYLVEALEPVSVDGFFAWGFFDAILQQKEYYSAYVFEDLAAEMLNDNDVLKAKLDKKISADADFALDGKAQLDFVYNNSDYHEPEYLRYPVFRLE